MRPSSPIRAIFFFSAAALCLSISVSAQQSVHQSSEPAINATTSRTATSSDPLPSAPEPAPAPSSVLGVSQQPAESPFTLHNRFTLEVHTTLGLSNFIAAAGDAAIVMAKPPRNFPREWVDGGGAYGRNYGAELGRNTAAGFTHFAVAAIDHEDPRYMPSDSTNYARRTLHALAFTLVDRTESGRPTLAVSNLAGSAAGGFIGNAWYPDGFNDTTHGLQRSSMQVSSFAIRNLIAEFSPELYRIARKLRLPDGIAGSILPRTARP